MPCALLEKRSNQWWRLGNEMGQGAWGLSANITRSTLFLVAKHKMKQEEGSLNLNKKTKSLMFASLKKKGNV